MRSREYRTMLGVMLFAAALASCAQAGPPQQCQGQCGWAGCPGQACPAPHCVQQQCQCALPGCMPGGGAMGCAVCSHGTKCNQQAAACGCGNGANCFCPNKCPRGMNPCQGGGLHACGEGGAWGCGGTKCQIPHMDPPECNWECDDGDNWCECVGMAQCMCMGQENPVKNCPDYCGQYPCGGALVCKDDGCGDDACVCGTYWCPDYTLGADDKPYPCHCWDCTFRWCTCATAGSCGDTNSCEVCEDDCSFEDCVCASEADCGQACDCECDNFGGCYCGDPADCGRGAECLGCGACAEFDTCPCPSKEDCGSQNCA